MTYPGRILTLEETRQKASLARRRSPLVWPHPEVPMEANVRLQARLALRETIFDHWSCYRKSTDQNTKAKFRSYLRAKITAIRLLS